MSGLDHLLAKSLDETIRENLGSNTAKKIENRLFEKFGISLTQGMEQFDKVDLVLREFFGKGADGLERKCFENIFQTKSKTKGNWYTITDPTVTGIILEAFGDPDKKKVLETVAGTPKITQEILEECDIPQTTGYRLVNNLVNDGLLYKSGEIARENKKINKYVCVFYNLRINIIKNKVSVDVQLTDSEQKQSSILKTIKI